MLPGALISFSAVPPVENRTKTSITTVLLREGSEDGELGLFFCDWGRSSLRLGLWFFAMLLRLRFWRDCVGGALNTSAGNPVELFLSPLLLTGILNDRPEPLEEI